MNFLDLFLIIFLQNASNVKISDLEDQIGTIQIEKKLKC